jgi:two-component system response regulator CpxR
MSEKARAGPNIAVVDDDASLREMLGEYLAAEGFRVFPFADGEAAAARLAAASPDLVVLDVMLPGIDGFEVLRRLRARSAVPVIMLTARGDDVDRIVGLEIGADDYLPKPFNPRELVARVRAVLRRVATTPAPEGAVVIPQGRLELFPRRLEATLDGGVIGLTAAEFRLLEVLVDRAGEVVTRETLCRRALGRRPHPLERALDTHVSNLRRKLGGSGDSPIRGVRGRGYQLLGEAPPA